MVFDKVFIVVYVLVGREDGRRDKILQRNNNVFYYFLQLK